MGIESSWMSRYPRELSGGELQRFCIARALGSQTEFLIADEMTTMLDVVTQAQIWGLMLDVTKPSVLPPKQRRGLILLSSHGF